MALPAGSAGQSAGRPAALDASSVAIRLDVRSDERITLDVDFTQSGEE
jgi:hypothetical protein